MDYSHFQGSPLVAGIIVLALLAFIGVLHFAFTGAVQVS